MHLRSSLHDPTATLPSTHITPSTPLSTPSSMPASVPPSPLITTTLACAFISTSNTTEAHPPTLPETMTTKPPLIPPTSKSHPTQTRIEIWRHEVLAATTLHPTPPPAPILNPWQRIQKSLLEKTHLRRHSVEEMPAEGMLERTRMYELPPGEIHGKEEGRSGGNRQGRMNGTTGMAAHEQRREREKSMGQGKWNDGVGEGGGAEIPRGDLGLEEGGDEESGPCSSDDAAARRATEKRMRLKRAEKLLARQRAPDCEKVDDAGDGDDDCERLRRRSRSRSTSRNSNPDFDPDLMRPGQWRLDDEAVWLRERV